MQILVFDWETFYGPGYTLRSMRTEAYIRDPRFEINILGFKSNNAPGVWMLRQRVEAFLREEIDWPNTALVAHHAHFDAAILYWLYGISPGMIIDTLTMARIVDGPKVPNDLEHCLERHGIGKKDTSVLRMAWGKRLGDFAPHQLLEYGNYCTQDCENEYKLFQHYLPHVTPLQLQLADIKIRMFTEPVFRGNVELLQQAVLDERTRKRAMLVRHGNLDRAQFGTDEAFDNALLKVKKEFSSSDKFAAILRQYGVEPDLKPGKPKDNKDGTFTPRMIYAFAKTDPSMQELLESDDDDVRFLAETRLEMKSTIIETRTQRVLDIARRGTIPVYIKPNGTHTTRASAGDGTNFMNLTSVNLLRPEMTVTKRSIHAPEGCMVVSADSSQIQARTTHWLAGQEDMVAAFAANRDVYSEFASLVFGRPVDRKKVKEDFVAGQVGKISELSYLFQKGWYGAAFDFLKGHLGAPPIQFTEKDMRTMQIDPSPFLNNPKKVERVEKMPSRLSQTDLMIHCIVTEATVKRWRAKNYKIAGRKGEPGLWDHLEGIINRMIAGDEVYFGPGGCLHTIKEGIVAPSGAVLRYRGLERNHDGAASYWNGRNREHIYAGLVTNNIAQLLEQEIIGAQIVQLHKDGIKIAVECYDNIVGVVPTELAKPVLDHMLKVMSTRKDWYADLPLKAEGGIGKTWYEAKES